MNHLPGVRLPWQPLNLYVRLPASPLRTQLER
jgi:hypothetical protein